MLNPSLRRRELIALLGGGMAWPLPGRAREAAKVPVIGVLWHAGSPDEEQPFFDALNKGFSELGYVEGQNISLEHRFPNEVPDRFRSMLAELLAMKVDVLVSITPASYFAKGATGSIPHIFVLVPDPVRDGFVDSLARPGGNATGLALLSTDLTKKRMHLLREAIPGLSRAGLLVPSPAAALNRAVIEAIIDEAQEAAAELGLPLRNFLIGSLDELEEAFDAMVRERMQAVLVGASGQLYKGRAAIAKLAGERRLPANFWAGELMLPGTFMCYGPSMAAIVRRAATYVDRILKGTKPSELPVEQPTRLELVINVKLAKAWGIDVPPMLLAQADEVIE
jgi:putative ABC transport system substrate-binding protein